MQKNLTGGSLTLGGAVQLIFSDPFHNALWFSLFRVFFCSFIDYEQAFHLYFGLWLLL